MTQKERIAVLKIRQQTGKVLKGIYSVLGCTQFPEATFAHEQASKLLSQIESTREAINRLLMEDSGNAESLARALDSVHAQYVHDSKLKD